MWLCNPSHSGPGAYCERFAVADPAGVDSAWLVLAAARGPRRVRVLAASRPGHGRAPVTGRRSDFVHLFTNGVS
jgi:hypothetical protein